MANTVSRVPVPTVLLAESDTDIKDLMVLYIKRAGFDSIIACGTGRLALGEALEILDRGEQLIVLTANEMDDGNGESLIQSLQLESEESIRSFEIIMMSAIEPQDEILSRIFGWIAKGEIDSLKIRTILQAAAEKLAKAT